MTDPGTGEHSVRSLAEILREHGLESEFGTRPKSRRRDDDPKADWPARPNPADQPPSRLRPGGGAAPAGVGRPAPSTGGRPGLDTGDRPARPREAPGPPPRQGNRPPAVTEAAAAEILRQHGLETEFGTRPGRRRGEGARADWPARPAPEDQPRSRLRPPPETPPAGRVARPREAPRQEVRAASAPVAAPPAAAPSGGTAPSGRSAPAAAPAVPPRAPRGGAPAAPSVPGARPPRSSGVPTTDDPVATGSFAAVVAGATADEGRDAAVAPNAGQSALAWARFAGELLVAVAIGVGTYFAFTVLWELLPYVALVAAPLVLTGLVAGVAAWRHRREQAQLGVGLLAVLVFAGTLLVIAPAAQLLSPG